MADLRLTQVPVAKTGMLIRKPVAEVFEAIVNPEITASFTVDGRAFYGGIAWRWK